jgi:hypothetical protein
LLNKGVIKILIKEIGWLLAIIGISALLEFVIIEMFDLHPILSIKLQGLIGLIIIGYGFRMSIRLWKSFNSSNNINQEDSESLD